MPYPHTDEPITAENPITSAVVRARPTPTYGTFGSFSVLARTQIAASPSAVLSVIRDTKNWAKWNSFCPSLVISPKSPPAKDSSDAGIPKGEEGWLELGTIAELDVFMSGDGLSPGAKRSRTQGIIITVLEAILPTAKTGNKSGYRIAWKGTSFSHWQMHSERTMEFLPLTLPDNTPGTEFSCWETFGGVLAPVVKATVGSTLVERFGDYQRDVKAYLETQSPAQDQLQAQPQPPNAE